MKYPKKLKNSISFIAPSFGCTFEPYLSRMNSAINYFENKNINVKVYENCTKQELPYRSNTALSCANEFINAYKDDNDVLISVGGGEYMVEILDHINFDEISKLEPKWFVGYSDNTNLTFLLTTLCDVATIYGPNAPYFGINNPHKNIEDTLDLLTKDKVELNSYELYEENYKLRESSLSPLVLDTPNNFVINKETTVTGRLIGGCLDIILNLIGTKYDNVSNFLEKYKEDGFIWFIEACDLDVIAVKRAFKQMENAGYFKYLKGVIIGKPLKKEEMFGINHLNCVDDILDKYNVLVIKDADLGHINPSMPLICGAIAKVSTNKNKYKIEMECR